MAEKTIIEGPDGTLYAKSKRPYVRHEERDVQRPIVKVLQALETYTKCLTFFHVPNQLLRRSAMRKIYAALGVRAGVPDLVVPIAGGRTLWVELKYGKNKTSGEQDGFLARLQDLGHIVEIIAATDSADAQTQLWAILKKHGVKGFDSD